MAMISESLLTINDYNKPLVIKDNDAVAILFLRLLIMVPGTNRLHPEMGINVRARYENCEEGEEEELKVEIQNQINTYMPSYSDSTVDCEIKNGNIFVSITVDDTVFKYSTAGPNLNSDDDDENESSNNDDTISLL